MGEKTALRIKYWAILLNPIFLILYFYGMQTLYKLCMYGGIRRHLSGIAGCGILGIVWIFIWTYLYFVKKKRGEFKESVKKQLLIFIFCLEILVLVGITGYFGIKIVDSGQGYTGKLSRKINEWIYSRKIELVHNNIYDDGIEGIFNDIGTKLDLPKELYLVNSFSLRFDTDGTITGIYSFFYGKNKKGERESFLLSYDSGKSDKMTITMENYGKGGCAETKNMNSLFRIIELTDIQSEVKAWNTAYGAEEFGILYYGYRTFDAPVGIRVLNSDGSEGELDRVEKDGKYSGYAVSLYVPDREEIIEPIRYMDGWSQVLIEDTQEEEPEYTYVIGKSTSLQTNGSIYYLLNEKLGWQLAVTEAALGSRWYEWQTTEDGGKTWKSVQPSPFPEELHGVAEEIKFWDEQFGFVLMGGASETHSELYMTNDGAASFTRVKISESIMPDTIENPDEYIYISMPEQEGNILKLELRREKYDNVGLPFESADAGQTWEYAGEE